MKTTKYLRKREEMKTEYQTKTIQRNRKKNRPPARKSRHGVVRVVTLSDVVHAVYHFLKRMKKQSMAM